MSTATEDTISRLYRAIVADSGTEGIRRADALDQLVDQVLPLWRNGQVELNPADLIRAAGRRIDEADGAAADDMLAAIAAGVDDLGLESDPILDRVVTLGRGHRKTWRNVVAADLQEMDANRYGNLRSAQVSYHKRWKPQVDAWLPVLMRHSTIGDAVEAQDFPRLDALFDVSA